MPDGWHQKGPDEAGLPERKQRQQQASKPSCFCIALRCTTTWLAGWEYSAARRRNTSFGICPRQEPLGQVGQKPLDSYRKRFGTKILLTWKSFNQPHEHMLEAPTLSLSLSLPHGQLNSFFSASSFFSSGSSLIAAHMQKQTNSEQVRSLPVRSE